MADGDLTKTGSNGGLLGGIIGAAGTVADIAGSYFNYKQQQKQFEYQKELNEKTMAREDNAMQRRMADLAKAGINPLQALGTPGAQASIMQSGQVPQLPLTEVGKNALSIAQGLRDAKRVDIENEAMLADADYKRAEAENMRENLIETRLHNRILEGQTDVYNSRYFEYLGIQNDLARSNIRLNNANSYRKEADNEQYDLQNGSSEQINKTGTVNTSSKEYNIMANLMARWATESGWNKSQSKEEASSNFNSWMRSNGGQQLSYLTEGTKLGMINKLLDNLYVGNDFGVEGSVGGSYTSSLTDTVMNYGQNELTPSMIDNIYSLADSRNITINPRQVMNWQQMYDSDVGLQYTFGSRDSYVEYRKLKYFCEKLGIHDSSTYQGHTLN